MLATLAMAGRDKVTFFASPSLRGFGGWAEQLLAESTGKRGKGLIPVDLEPIGAPEAYGDDRVFVHLQLADEPVFDGQLISLETAGHPVISITLVDRYGLGIVFLRWAFATAAAGAILINRSTNRTWRGEGADNRGSAGDVPRGARAGTRGPGADG